MFRTHHHQPISFALRVSRCRGPRGLHAFSLPLSVAISLLTLLLLPSDSVSVFLFRVSLLPSPEVALFPFRDSSRSWFALIFVFHFGFKSMSRVSFEGRLAARRSPNNGWTLTVRGFAVLPIWTVLLCSMSALVSCKIAVQSSSNLR